MSAPNSPEQGSHGEDINTYSEVHAEHVLDEASQCEVDEPISDENGQELTPLEIPENEFLRSKRCTNIVHCREIMYTILNMCFKVSRYIESYYRYDDLAVSNGTTQTLLISDIFDWIDRLSNEVKRKNIISIRYIQRINGSYPTQPTGCRS